MRCPAAMMRAVSSSRGNSLMSQIGSVATMSRTDLGWLARPPARLGGHWPISSTSCHSWQSHSRDTGSGRSLITEGSLALRSEEPLDDRERLVRRGLNVVWSADFLAAVLVGEVVPERRATVLRLPPVVQQLRQRRPTALAESLDAFQLL